MPAEATIETHLNAGLKQEVEAIYAAAGVSIAEVVQRLIERSAKDKAVPYGLFGPNAETREAMEELRESGGKKFASVADLMADLNADD